MLSTQTPKGFVRGVPCKIRNLFYVMLDWLISSRQSPMCYLQAFIIRLNLICVYLNGLAVENVGNFSVISSLLHDWLSGLEHTLYMWACSGIVSRTTAFPFPVFFVVLRQWCANRPICRWVSDRVELYIESIAILLLDVLFSDCSSQCDGGGFLHLSKFFSRHSS